ncbi:SWI/SNF-related matrix-associated actin-dependent regulator of chromatin subfamily A-like protein 1 [Atheta coriaria]|uniref:SWI/SNF-related matrix-associated actin-dependent regulator of chromatin subfamily A-like protein 1 n=1 Tax=Dalotia coriaria TaxID=877792 RepID=UPI0031F3BE45
MLCTAAEIERKKRLAKVKLLQKRTQHSRNLNDGPGITSNLAQTNTSPASPKFFPKAKSVPGTSSSFDKSPKPRNNSFPSSNNKFNTKPFNNDQRIQATCILLTSNRFQVKLSAYFNVAIEVMKTIPSKSYDPKTCNWNFSLDHYDMLLSKLDKLNSHLQVVKLPLWIHNLKRKPKDDCYDFSIIDEELRNTLMPFQEESLCFAIERNGRCFIADEMGLGKTIQALAIAAYYRQDWPILIVTTASTSSSWEVTICKYLTSIPIMNVQVLGSKNDHMDKPTVIITSYDMMTRRTDHLLTLKCGICIFDESHSLKNFKTKCFKSALTLAKLAKRVLLLSGTPALSKPSELFTQLQLIDESFFINFMEFSKRYCDGKESTFGWDSSGQSNLEELQIVLEQRFMIRRTKDTISALDLPEKVQEIIHLNISEADLNVKELEVLKDTDMKKNANNIQLILPFFHNTAKIKIPAVTAYITKLLQEETRKFIIFGHHMIMLDAIERVLNESSKGFIRIDGRTTDREKQVRLFQTSDSVSCALLSITAANSGITLTAAEMVIFTELHWTPSILAQAEARAHRIGQTKPVTIRYLIGSKTVDDYIWPMLQSKQRTLNEMKLTTDSFDNFKTMKCKATPQKSTITNYFSPKSDAKRVKLEDVFNATEAKNEVFAMPVPTSSKAVVQKSGSVWR